MGGGRGISGKAYKLPFTVVVTESKKKSDAEGDTALQEHQTSKVALKNTSLTPGKAMLLSLLIRL